MIENKVRDGFDAISERLKQLFTTKVLPNYESEIYKAWLYGCCFHRSPELAIAAISFLDNLECNIDATRLKSPKDTFAKLTMLIGLINDTRSDLFAYVECIRGNLKMAELLIDQVPSVP